MLVQAVSQVVVVCVVACLVAAFGAACWLASELLHRARRGYWRSRTLARRRAPPPAVGPVDPTREHVSDGTPDTVLRLDDRPLDLSCAAPWIQRGVLGPVGRAREHVSDGTPDTVLRVDHRALDLSCAALWIQRGTLGPVADTLERLGFEWLGARDPAVPLSVSKEVGVDLRLDDTLHLLAREFGTVEPRVFFTATFRDAGDAFWTEAAHREQRLVVFVSEQPPDAYEHRDAFLLDSLAGLCGLVVYAFTDGLGTRAPAP